MKTAGAPLWGALVVILALFFSGINLYAQESVSADPLEEYRLGHYENAVDICEKQIKSSGGNLETHVIICWSLLALKRYVEVRRFALAGREISRYDPRLIEILGEVNYFQGNNADALQHFQEYINLAPQGSRIDMVYYYLGEIYIRQGKYRHADIAMTTAVYYMPRNAEWWTRLAYARENAGDTGEAIAAYQQALNLNSQLVDARSGLDRLRGQNR